MRGAEGVVDVDVAQRGELAGKCRDRSFLPRRGSAGFPAAALRRAWAASPPPADRRNREPSPPACPAASARRSAQGARLISGFGLPLGRPRWLARISAAPWSSAYWMLGSDALMRLSLVISLPPGARGTLKSTRMKTRLFRRSRSRMESVLIFSNIAGMVRRTKFWWRAFATLLAIAIMLRICVMATSEQFGESRCLMFLVYLGIPTALSMAMY